MIDTLEVATPFMLLSWGLCGITGALLAFTIAKYRFLVVKPSITVIAAFHVMIQWAAAVRASEIERALPDPWAFLLLAHGFPLCGLMVSVFLGAGSASKVWHRICRPRRRDAQLARRATAVLGIAVAGVTLLYLRAVPWASTGLYAILTDPLSLNAAQAREDSLKLLDSATVRYSYSFMINALAPLLAVLLAMEFPSDARHRRFGRLFWAAAALLGVLVAVSLSGARANSAIIILAVLFAYLLRSGLPIRLGLLSVVGVAVLVVPTLLTILREGGGVEAGTFWRYLSTGIAKRVFVTPMEMGLWHTHYAQTEGFFGVAGMQRFAPWFGVVPVNVANRIAQVYAPEELPTTLANCSYVFSYYSYFGLISLPVSLLGLWALDGALVVYKRLSAELLVPCVAAVTICAMTFVSNEYLLVLVTNGFIVLLGSAWVLQLLGSRRAPRHNDPRTARGSILEPERPV